MNKLNNLLFPFIYFFVFLTGAAGLIYEVTWQKYLGRLLGSDTIAIAIIMGTFLGGLSLGYFLIGKLSTRIKNHLRAYALLEAIIAICCLLFPGMFDMFFAATRTFSFEPPVIIILQGVASSFVLFGIPTICMGATVPLLTRGISQNIVEATGVHAKVYGVNTGGACIGTLAAGFWLIPYFGLPLTIMGTALLNLGTAVFFFQVSKMSRFAATEADTGADKNSNPTSPGSRVSGVNYGRISIYAIGFLSGFAVMTMENVLFRISNLSFGSSSYSFSLVLSVFLLAIALGSYAVSLLKRVTPTLLFFNQAILVMLLFCLYLTLDLWPYMAHLIRVTFQSNQIGFFFYYFACFVVMLTVLLPTLFFTGATVPIAFHIIKQDLRDVGRHSGLLLSFNTIGSLLGSILGGIALYYILDNPRIYLVAMILTALSALLCSLAIGWRYRIAATVLLVAACAIMATAPFYNMKRFAYGHFRIRTEIATTYAGPRRFSEEHLKGQDVLYQNDGPACSVSVLQSQQDPEQLSINVNGKSDSGTIGDIYTLKLIAHLPSLLARQRKSAAVVGIGTGVTVGELAKYPEFERIDVAEMSPEVTKSLKYFKDATGDVGKDPRLHIHQGDAFRVFSRTAQKWDIIISEPSNPWVMGVDMVFTREFYKLVKEHLNPDGMFLQWVQTYASSPEMLGLISNTLRNEFEELNVFYGSAGDLLFLATNHKLDKGTIRDAERVLASNPKVAESLAALSLNSIDGILVRQVWVTPGIETRFSDKGIQTLDNPRLHYIAGRDFFLGKKMGFNSTYPFSSSFLSADYLLFRKYPDWINQSLTAEKMEELKNSLRTSIRDPKKDQLPMVSSLELFAHLTQPDRYPLSREKQVRFSLGFLYLSFKPSIDEADWGNVGLENATMRRRAELLVEHVSKQRRWLVPFPIRGLKGLLGREMETANTPEDQNWYRLSLARILLLESSASNEAINILSKLVTDKQGDPIVDEGGHEVLEKVKRLLALREKRQQS